MNIVEEETLEVIKVILHHTFSIWPFQQAKQLCSLCSLLLNENHPRRVYENSIFIESSNVLKKNRILFSH